jgi:pilus assembly protein CpaF
MECALGGVPPALRILLEDPSVTDICLTGHHHLSFDRGNGMEHSPNAAPFPGEPEYRQFILEQLSLSGRTWDAKLPFVDTVFFRTHRAHLVFPPIAQSGICLSLRRLPTCDAMTWDEQVKMAELRWQESGDAFRILKESIHRHETLILAGATGSGKTTLFNDLLLFSGVSERIIALEDTAEIRPQHPGFLGLLSRPPNPDGFGAVRLRDLVRQTLRMRPDRILIGECRGDEVLDLLLALNTGHRGTVTTLHSNSASDAIRRLELLALIASKGEIPPSLIRNLIVRGVQKIAHLVRDRGGRRISEIISLEGVEQDTVVWRRLLAAGLPRTNAPTPRGIHKEAEWDGLRSRG